MGFKNEHVHEKKDVARINERKARGRRLRSALLLLGGKSTLDLMLDTLKGAACTFIGVLIIFAMWVSLWENVWRTAVEPVRGAIYDTRLNRFGPSPCLFAHHGGGGGRRVVV
jgi:hypothetical protein